MRKGLAVAFAIVILGVIAAPLQAEDDPNAFTLKAGSHRYVIPRHMIQMIMSAEGPVWVAVQGPESTVPTNRDQQAKTRRMIDVSFPMGRAMSVTRTIENLKELRCSPEIGDAPYGLRELRNCMTKETHEYIASPDGGAEYVMRCISYSCRYDFDYLDLPVNVSFDLNLLSEWRDIHRRTLSLLDSLRKD